MLHSFFNSHFFSYIAETRYLQEHCHLHWKRKQVFWIESTGVRNRQKSDFVLLLAASEQLFKRATYINLRDLLVFIYSILSGVCTCMHFIA